MNYDPKDTEEYKFRKAHRTLRMKQKKQKRQMMIVTLVLINTVIVIGAVLGIKKLLKNSNSTSEETAFISGSSFSETQKSETDEPAVNPTITTPTPESTKDANLVAAITVTGDDLHSAEAYMVRLSDNKVFLDKNAAAMAYPASVTKIMTILLSVEYLTNLDAQVTIEYDDVQNAVIACASRADFSVGETVTVRDLLFGAMLLSGADACYALARTVAGSETAFVELMNQKAVDLGLTTTHFTNCVGLHDENHFSSCYDMSLVLEYALQNETFRALFTAPCYQTSRTTEHPEGIMLYTTTSYALNAEYKLQNGATILGGKTGYTDEAGRCLATLATYEGEEYILITFGAPETTGNEGYYSGIDAKNVYGSLCMVKDETLGDKTKK